MGVALVLASFGAGRSAYVFLLLGIVGSISVGMTYTICISAVASRYQGKGKGLATGLTACGLAVGTIAGSIIVEDLVVRFDVMAALLGMGVSSVAAAFPAGLLLASVDPVAVRAKSGGIKPPNSFAQTIMSRSCVP